MGRELERKELDARLKAAHAGQGQVVVVAGEPGIGKTRLAEEAIRMAHGLGMASAWGRAVEDDGSPPYFPFRQVVRSLAASPLDLWMELTSDAERGPVPAQMRAQERFRAFEEITSFFVSAAAENGLLVVLDDIQWADASSLRLLVHLVRGIGEARLAVIATYRDTEIGQRDALKQALGELARESAVSRLRLVGLTESQVAEQLTTMTGSPISGEVAAVVSRRSQGNPFFVRELAGALAHSQDVPDVVRVLPEGVRDAVRSRLAKLSARSRNVVAVAAVLGCAADLRGLAQAAECDADTILTALDDAAAAGVIDGERWDFTHDLIREVARSEVARSARLNAHLRMAEFLERQADADARPAELAHHWLESLPLGAADRAASWAERAARAALAQLAWDEAVELYRRAAAVVDDPVRRCELVIARASAQLSAYHLREARKSMLDAVRLARTIDDDGKLFARAVLVMEGINDLTWADDERVLCEEALTRLSPEDSALRARLLAQLSVDCLMSEVPERAAELSQAALAMAERLSDKAGLRAALRARQVARSDPDGVHERLALGDRFLAMGIADADDDAIMWGRLWRFDALMQVGDLDGAEVEAVAIASVVNRLRLPLASWHLLRCQGAIALARGRFDEAEACGRQALALAEGGEHPGGLLPSQGFLAILGMLIGFTDNVIRPPVEDWQHVAAMHGMIALVYWYEGRRDEARRFYASMQPLDRVPGFLLLALLSGAIELAEEFDDRPMLDAAYHRLSLYADLFCCGGAGVIATTGSAHGPLGMAAAALGRLDDAVRHLRQAIEANGRAGSPPFAASARFELARALARRRRPGDREEAAALAAMAASAARDMGMRPLLGRAEKLSATMSGDAPGPLTRREREIAALVSQGLTNRQIGAATHISERTAENHVQHILTKLGFTTRAQIAAWVARGEK